MQLQDFNTLAEAQAYEQKTYRKIGGNEASQLLSKTSALDSIEDNVANVTPVEVVAGDPTTVGALCRTVIRTLNGGQFATDPSTEDGMVNRGSSAILVVTGVLTQSQVDGFYAKAETVSFPYANRDEYSFQIAKGTVPKVELTDFSANGDFVRFSTTGTAPQHTPRVTNSADNKVGNVYGVALAGWYAFAVPVEARGTTLFIDNPYGVVG